MSDKRTQEEKAEKLKSEEALKLFQENCKNYLIMNSQERSEGLKINYLLGLIKLSDNLKIDDESFIKTLFDEILFKDLSLLKSRSLFSNFIYELEKRRNPDLFQKKFFSLLNTFGSEYNTNSIYFHQYLIDMSLCYIFNSFICEEKTKYIEMIIDNDIKPFETQLFKRIINKTEKLIDNNMNKKTMVKCLFNKFIDMNKYKSCLILFIKILENVNNNSKNIPKEIIYELIQTTNIKGFNHVIKKTKEINDFLIFNCLLLGNLDEKLFISEEDIEMLDSYLVNLLNLLSLKKDLNVDIFNKIYKFYIKKEYKNLNKIFFDVLYYLSTYSYSNAQYEFIFNCINNNNNDINNNNNLIFNKIIRNHLLSLNKRPVKYKENLHNKKNEKFLIINDINITSDFNLIEHSLFSFNNNINNISFLNHLNLFHYIIDSSFTINNSTENNEIIIQFYPKLLNRILILLNNLSLENSNKKLFEEILMFLLNLISVLFNLYFSDNNLNFNEDYLLDSIMKIIDKASSDNKYLIIFPSLINIIKTILKNEFSNNDNFDNNKLYNFLFDYIITNFSYSDNSDLINNQQIILIFKSLIILFTDKKISKLHKKLFSLDKLIDLVLKSCSEKVQFSFLKFCEELIKDSKEENINLSQYSLNKYSKIINDYMNEPFIDFISEKFSETFMQKRPSSIEFNENTYFVINTINNIYNNSCIKYNNLPNDKLNSFIELIEEFCGSKLIIGVCDHLFMSIEKNECDLTNTIKEEKNIFDLYDKLNNCLDNLEYYIYMKDNYFDKNIRNNKITMCHYGILKSLAHLLSGYLSNSIYTLFNWDENKIEGKDKQEENINNLFDYIKTKILLNETLKNTSYPVYFLNTVFSNKYILHYFCVNYTNYSINKISKETQQEITFINDMIEKNNAFINYITQNKYFIIFMKDIIKSFIEFDSSILLGNKKNNLNWNKNTDMKLFEKRNIINELISKEDKLMTEYNESQKAMINSFFSKMFLNEIFEKNTSLKNIEQNQIIFLFLLDNSLLEIYFNFFGYFINIDYTIIQIYSFIRSNSLPVKLNEKIINFISKRISLDNFRNIITGIINNSKIFNSFFKSKNISKNYIYNLYDIMKFIINNIINTNEYKNINEKLTNILQQIIDHINSLYKINQNFANLELYLFGKILCEIITKLNQKLLDKQNENNEESNEMKDDIAQINFILESIYSLIVPKYLKSIYNSIENIDNNVINFEYSLDNVFLPFYIALDILSKIKDNEKYYENKMESDIINFFNRFLEFNLSNKYLVDLNYFNLLREKYNENKNEPNKKKFLEYLYLFSLFKGKQDEKNLKSVIIEFFGDYQDVQTKSDFKKYGFITSYFLCSIKKDSTIGNKNNNSTIINPIDFYLIKNIGERFKDDEKSLQRSNTLSIK